MMDSLIKITDRTEILLPLDRGHVYKIVVGFREYCLGKFQDIYPKGFEKEKIDERVGLPKTSSEKTTSEQMQEIRDSLLHYFGYDYKSYKPMDCIVELLRNPRSLKRSLAHTWSAWQKLHGEIHFDDLLAVHTVRVAAPKVFEILATNIGVFRLFIDSKSKHSNKKLCDKIELVLKEQNIDSVSVMLYHQLIGFLFPGWKIPKDHDTKESGGKIEEYVNQAFAGKPHPQGIAINEPADYFYRLTSEDVAGDDQHTMKDILEYNKGGISEEILMGKMIEDAQYSARIEYFGRLLTPEKVLYLTSAYFKMILKYDYRRFSDYELTARLWRIHLKNSASEKFHQEWLCETLSIYLPISIQFANDIFYFWKFRKDSEADSKYARPEIEQMYKNLIESNFQNEPEKIIKALASCPEHIWTVRHLLFKNSDNDAIKKYEKPETFFSDWQSWFIDLLLTASEIDPKLIAMFLVPLLYDLSRAFGVDKGHEEDDLPIFRDGWKASFDQHIANLLFSEDLPKVMKIVSKLIEEDYAGYELGEQEQCILDYAVSHSKKWLEEQGKNKPTE